MRAIINKKKSKYLNCHFCYALWRGQHTTGGGNIGLNIQIHSFQFGGPQIEEKKKNSPNLV